MLLTYWSHVLPVRVETRFQGAELWVRVYPDDVHVHSFEPDGGDTLMRDVVRYALPLGPLGEVARVALVRRDLDRIFDFRHAEIARRFNK